MSFQTHCCPPQPKDSSSNKGEISLLLHEIDSLESKKQELLKTLSFYHTTVTTKGVSDSCSIKSNGSNSSQMRNRTLKGLAKELQKTSEEMNLVNKSTDGANKPSHLYMALAKYLFHDQSNSDVIDSCEQKTINDALFSFEQKLVKVKSFDNVSLESVSTKDNFSLSAYESSNYKENYLSPIDEEKLKECVNEKKQLDSIWSLKNQKLLCKYAEELNNDWASIAQKFNNKKVTPKMVKDHLGNNKDKSESLSQSNKRTRSRFTLAEDQKIINMIQKIGQNWRDIAKALPGRTEGMVKNRFYSHIKRKYFALVQNGKMASDSSTEECEKIITKIETIEENLAASGLEDMILEQNIECPQEEHKSQDHNALLPFFNQENENEKMDFDEEKLEYNLLKTPETSYNFDDYNHMLKLTPNEKFDESFLLKCENSDSSSMSQEEEENDYCSNSNKKLKIRFLSNKIEDIEHLLLQTKSQINKLYCVE